MKVTPLHNKFLEAIADSPIHIIATMRGKDQYELQKEEDGSKLSVKKLGVGAKQREGFEYEFTISFLLDQKMNYAEAQKDNTHLFEKERARVLTEKDGISLIRWANSGEGYTPPIRHSDVQKLNDEELLKSLHKEIYETCKEMAKGEHGKEMSKLLKEYEPNAGNINKVKNVEKLQELKLKLAELVEQPAPEAPAEEPKEEPA